MLFSNSIFFAYTQATNEILAKFDRTEKIVYKNVNFRFISKKFVLKNALQTIVQREIKIRWLTNYFLILFRIIENYCIKTTYSRYSTFFCTRKPVWKKLCSKSDQNHARYKKARVVFLRKILFSNLIHCRSTVLKQVFIVKIVFSNVFYTI